MTHAPFIYNPALLSADALTELFIARTRELGELMEGLRRTGARPTHHVIVGQRGSGKSTMLHKIAVDIECDDSLRAQWTPLTFSEEQYNVRDIVDLLSNAVDALIERLEQRGDKTAADKLQRELDALSGPDRGRQLVRMLEAYAKRTRTRLLLLIDNLDDVLQRLSSDDEWKLRELLNEHKWIAIIGASPNMLESAYTHGAAFYEFFRVHELEGLDDEQTLAFFDRLAEVQNAAHVRAIVREDPGRIAAVRRLAGGNLRALVQLFEVLAQNSVGTVEDDLQRLLDRCSPLYKARLDALSVEQQAVFSAVALGWYTMTARELCDAMKRDDINAVSSQLDRLCKQGLIERVNIGESRDGFRVVERLFNIWFLMRFSRRTRQKVLWLVEFLRDFYSASQLREFGVTLLQQGDGSERHARMMFATASALGDGPVKEALERHAIEAMVNAARELSELMGPSVDAADRDIADRATNIATMKEVKRAIYALKDLPEGVTHEFLWNGVGAVATWTPQEKLKFIRDYGESDVGRIGEVATLWLTAPTNLHDEIKKPLEHFNDSIRRGLIASAYDLDGVHAEAITSGLPIVDIAMEFLVSACKSTDDMRRLCAVISDLDSPSSRSVWYHVVCQSPWVDRLLEYPAIGDQEPSILRGDYGAIRTQATLVRILISQTRVQQAVTLTARLFEQLSAMTAFIQAVYVTLFATAFALEGHPTVALRLIREANLLDAFVPLSAALEATLPGGDPTFARLPPEIASLARELLPLLSPVDGSASPAQAPNLKKPKRTRASTSTRRR